MVYKDIFLLSLHSCVVLYDMSILMHFKREVCQDRVDGWGYSPVVECVPHTHEASGQSPVTEGKTQSIRNREEKLFDFREPMHSSCVLEEAGVLMVPHGWLAKQHQYTTASGSTRAKI